MAQPKFVSMRDILDSCCSIRLDLILHLLHTVESGALRKWDCILLLVSMVLQTLLGSVLTALTKSMVLVDRGANSSDGTDRSTALSGSY
jgi:hypothetical protein